MELPSFTKTYHHDVYPAIDPSRPELSAAGKVVLITGGGRGIGASHTQAFATAGAADIVILGRSLATLAAMKKEIESQPTNKTRIHIYSADVTDEARINAVFDEVVSKIGRIDVFVANVGYAGKLGSFAQTNLDDWWSMFEINVRANAVAAQAFLRCASTKDPVLISINSVIGHHRYLAPFSGYASSKTALARVMDHVAAENPHVRVYNVHPGTVDTDMTREGGAKFSSFESVALSGAFSVFLSSPEGASCAANSSGPCGMWRR